MVLLVGVGVGVVLLGAAVFTAVKKRWPVWVFRKSIGVVYASEKLFHTMTVSALERLTATRPLLVCEKYSVSDIHDEKELREVCLKALHGSSKVLLSVGVRCSSMLVRCAKELKSGKAIVFMGVVHPVQLGLVTSLEQPGGLVTGVRTAEVEGVDQEVAMVKTVRADAKRVLLVFTPGGAPHGTEQRARQFQHVARANGLSATLLPISVPSRALPAIDAALRGHDVLLYLEGDILVNFAAELGALAARRKVVFCAGSIEGLAYASASISVYVDGLAEVVFDMAQQIALEGAKPGAIPVREVTCERFTLLNSTAQEQQKPEGFVVRDSKIVREAV